MERHDGVRRPALARPFALRRARRLRGGGTVRPFRRRSLGGRLARDRGLRGDGQRSSACSPSACASRAFTCRCSRSRSPSWRESRSTTSTGWAARAGCSCASPNATASICCAFRGPPAMYYYAILALAAGALALCSQLLRRRAGYYWRAIREDEVAAQALGIDTFWLEDARRRAQRRDDRGRGRLLSPSITTASSPSRSSASGDRSRSSWVR